MSNMTSDPKCQEGEKGRSSSLEEGEIKFGSVIPHSRRYCKPQTASRERSYQIYMGLVLGDGSGGGTQRALAAWDVQLITARSART